MEQPNSPLHILKTFLAFTGTGAVVGAGLGALLGRVAPSYYRTVFHVGSDQSFDAVGVGLGLGLTQGLFGGALIAAVYLFAPQLRNSFDRKSETPLVPESRVWLPWTIVIVIAFLWGLRSISTMSSTSAPAATWSEGQIILHNFSSKHVIATHLITDQVQAALSPPAFLRDHGEVVTIDVQKLDWRFDGGQKAPVPPSGSPIRMIFVPAETTMR